MKLQNVKIENFKGINSLSFNPEKLNVLVAENGKGKTSTIEAIRYLLTGEYPDNVMKLGTKNFSVTGLIAGEEVLRGRKIKTNRNTGLEEEAAIFKLNGKNTTAKSFNELMETRGVDLDVMKTISSKELMEMDVDTLTNFLLQVVPTTIDLDKLISLEPSITMDMEEEIAEILPVNNITLDDISNADTYFSNQRKQYKQMCEQKKAQCIYNGPDLSNEDEGALQKQYEENIAKIAMLKEKKATVTKIKDMIASRDKMLNSIKEKQELADALKCEKPNADKLNELKERIKVNTNTINENKSIVITLKNNIITNKKVLENLDSDICPLSGKLICKTDKTPLKQELSDSIKDNELQIDVISKSIDNYESVVKKAEEEIDAFNKANMQYEKYINALKSIEELKKNLPKEIKEETVENIDFSAIEFENRIIKEKLDSFKKYDEVKKNSGFLKILESKRDMYTDLCKIFDEKNGLREKILAFALEPFEEYVNARAKEINLNMNIKIEANKGVRILYTPKGSSEYMSYSNASAGEKLILSFLILDMINALSGMGILFLDNLDKLDEENLERVLSLITKPEVLDAYDHIFVAMVNHTEACDKLSNIKANQITL